MTEQLMTAGEFANFLGENKCLNAFCRDEVAKHITCRDTLLTAAKDKEIGRLREVLEVYADKDNWEDLYNPKTGRWRKAPILKDKGMRAKAALAQHKEGM